MDPSEEFLCVRCARHMKTCCQTSEIFVSLADVARIREASGREDFFERRAPHNPSYADQDDDPVWRDAVFGADGKRRVLRRRPDGDCTFLGPRGCELSLEIRPLVCRIYPFEYDATGIVDDSLDPRCPRELLKPRQGLLQALGMERADAERWRTQLYSELVAEPTAAAPEQET